MTGTTPPASFPPGPGGAPDTQLADFTADPFAALERARATHGPVFTLHLGDLGNEPRRGVEHNGRWVFLGRPDLVRALHESPGLAGADANRVFFGTDEDSVGYVDGDVHRDRRAHLQPLLAGYRELAPLVEQVTARHLRGWPRRRPVTLLPLLQALTAEVITTVVCGTLPDEVRRSLRTVLVRTEDAELGPDAAGAAEREVKEVLAAHLDTTRPPGDLFTALAAVPHWAPATVVDETFSLLYTGFSTTANTLAWALAELRAHPGELAAARDEADAAGDGADEGGGAEHRPRASSRLDAVLHETLRLHPVSALNGVRMTTEDVEIGGHRIPERTVVVQCAHLAHRDPDVFDEPDTFRTARHLECRVRGRDVASFGGGTRTCVGRAFALREMRVVLATLLCTVDLDPAPLPGARREGIFMAPADRVLTVLTDREAS